MPTPQGFATLQTPKDLVAKLLDVRPVMRGTAQSIKKHEFFEGVDWYALLTKNLLAPYSPCFQSHSKIMEVAYKEKASIWKRLDKEENGDSPCAKRVPQEMVNWEDEF